MNNEEKKDASKGMIYMSQEEYSLSISCYLDAQKNSESPEKYTEILDHLEGLKMLQEKRKQAVKIINYSQKIR